MKRHWEWEFDVPRTALWRYVADTDWVNRHAGLPKISARIEPLPGGGTKRLAWFGAGAFRVEWEERPTLWRAPEFYETQRLYTRGPLRSFINRTTLVELGPARTRLVVDIELKAANAVTRPLLPAIAMQGKAGADRAFALAAKLARGNHEERGTRSSRFSALRNRGVDPAVVEALERMLNESDDRELARIRPYEVAERYGIARRAMLRAFLAATREGLLNLRWDVMCPSCRGTPNSFDRLEDLRSDLHCDTCNLPYGPQFDRSVEVTFNARPLGRGIDVPLYCIASPQRSAHVLSQAVIPARERATLELPLTAGAYDLNAIGRGIAPFVATQDERARCVAGAVKSNEVSFPHEIATGDVQLQLENETSHEAVVRVETGRWPDTIATAAQVTAFQEFRDLFSSEVLAPGLELGIETLAILFTDLIGSTAMYSSAGDAPAFKTVTDHFERMRDVIESNDGAIVKTIGDAVMAVFASPSSCLRAALELDDAVGGLYHDGAPLRLRVGFHVGPCIAVRANDRIDYFGTTANLAARLEAVANAGEVTLAKSVADRPDIESELARCGRQYVIEERMVKGIPRPVSVVHVLQKDARA